MDKFNPRENEKLLKAYERVIEQMPYDGIHIHHQDKVNHIKKIYKNTYKITQSPSSKSWYVMGKNGNEWVPVTSGFADKDGATKFMQWLTKAGEMQQKMVGTITGVDKRLNETEVIGTDTESLPKCPKCGRTHKEGECTMEENINESVGGRLHGVFGDLFDYLENNFYQGDPDAFQKVIPNLKKETEKLYKYWQKNLKGKGLIGW